MTLPGYCQFRVEREFTVSSTIDVDAVERDAWQQLRRVDCFLEMER